MCGMKLYILHACRYLETKELLLLNIYRYNAALLVRIVLQVRVVHVHG